MKFLLLSLLLVCSSATFADNIKRPDSYNFTRGVEALQNDNYEEALEYLEKEVAEHPDNGYAYSWIALVRVTNEEFGRALSASNMAVKKIPAKDKEYKAFAYVTRGKIYTCLEDTVQGLKDYTQAIAVRPDYDKLYDARAQVYFEQGRYDLAEADYQKMIALNEGDVKGYMGLGSCANAQKKYDEAIKQFDYVNKLDPNYSSAYSYRAESYMGLKKYNEAIDDVITALKIDEDDNAFYLLQELADSAFNQTVAKVKVQKIKEPKEISWAYYLGVIYERVNKYSSAIPYYKEYMAQEPLASVAYRIAFCYDEMGDYDNALDYCDQAIAMDSTETVYLFHKANLLFNAEKNAEAIKAMGDYIALNPENSFSYYRRGWFKEHSGDTEGALEDYNISISLEPTDPYAYMARGVLYLQQGDRKAAEDDLKQVIKLDSIPENAECAHYAYCYLGNNEKAVEILNKALEKDQKGNYYDAACIYSLMGDTEKSVAYLRKSLESGYRGFAHIRRDRDLNNIRPSKEYQALMQEYEEKHKAEIAEEKEETVYEQKTEEIPFTKESGVCKVKCSINDLPLHFIFDTGAADVSMSSVEATFMLKNDYLSSSDIIGRQNYMTADGNISEGTVIRLRDVKLGSLHLKDIKASVVRNQSAPLLLGQSVLSRLGKIEIDNSNKVLRVTYKQKVK